MKSHNGDRTYSFLQKEQYTNQVLMLILPLNLGQTCKEGNFISVKVIYFSFSVSKQENNVLICELAFLLLTSSRGRPLYLKQRLNLYKIKFLQVFIGKLISLLNYLNNKLTFKNILFQSLSFCGNFSTFSSQFIFWLLSCASVRRAGFTWVQQELWPSCISSHSVYLQQGTHLERWTPPISL